MTDYYFTSGRQQREGALARLDTAATNADTYR
jgi:hypothetical protein